MNKRHQGLIAEGIVRDYYQNNNYEYIESNYTIRGGELDLIFTKENKIIFVEVKTIKPNTDLFDFVLENKLKHIYYTIQEYSFKNNINLTRQIDIVFVCGREIKYIYQNIALD